MTITTTFLNEVKDFCGECGTDSDTLITGLITAADLFLQGAIGADYPADDERALTVLKIIVNDFYNNRDYMESNRVSANTRKLIDSMILQLQMELRKASEVV